MFEDVQVKMCNSGKVAEEGAHEEWDNDETDWEDDEIQRAWEWEGYAKHGYESEYGDLVRRKRVGVAKIVAAGKCCQKGC